VKEEEVGGREEWGLRRGEERRGEGRMSHMNIFLHYLKCWSPFEVDSTNYKTHRVFDCNSSV
jgi:hypothetical protein